MIKLPCPKYHFGEAVGYKSTQLLDGEKIEVILIGTIVLISWVDRDWLYKLSGADRIFYEKELDKVTFAL